MDDLQELLSDFIIEASENLEEFEAALLELEKNPEEKSILDTMFRNIHSIKGASGFFEFGNVESVSHKAENVLDLLRSDQGSISKELISTFLKVCDCLKELFETIQAQGNDGDKGYEDLVKSLADFEEAFKNGEDLSDLSNEIITVEVEEETSEERTEEPSADDNAAASSNLDPVQIESLRALGLSDEEIFGTSGSAETEDSKEAEVVEIKESPKEEPKAKKESKTAVQKPLQKKETIRVDVETLDKLVNLAGELVLVRNQVLELSKHNESQAFDSSFNNLDNITGDIQRTLMATRMQPISTLWNKIPRVVRDLAGQLGKKVEVVMEGEGTELDKTIIEAISDPMTHIIRNCVDHGIETIEDRLAAGKDEVGHIKLHAEHRGNWIYVDITDDGKGIKKEVIARKAIEKELFSEAEIEKMSDQEIVNIVFHPGFSTKDQVSNVSGRGVGMDVIKQNIAKINGNVEITSEEGVGTHMQIKLPLTLAIIPAVIVSINEDRYAIPQNSVQEVATASLEEIQVLDDIQGQKYTRLRGEILPLIFANKFLDIDENLDLEKAEELNYVVINSDGHLFGLVIDRVMDIIEIVVKPLESETENFDLYAGATIMGDGKVALILDVNKIAQESKLDRNAIEENGSHMIHDKRIETSQFGSQQLTLLFEIADHNKYLIALSKTSRIEEISRDDIEFRQVGTFAKFQGSILRIIDLASLLGHSHQYALSEIEAESIKVLYFEFNGKGIFVYIGENHSLWQQNYHVERSNDSEFVVGTSLINDAVYEVVEIEDYLSKVVTDIDYDLEEEQKLMVQNYENYEAEMDETSLDSKKIICFKLEGLHFGIDIDAVREIINTEIVTESPGSKEEVSGLLNLRGEILVSMSLEKILGLDASLKEVSALKKQEVNEDEPSSEQEHDEFDDLLMNGRSLIVSCNDKRICVEVDKVDEILAINNDDIATPPSNIPDNILSFLKGVHKLDQELLLILDEGKLVSNSLAINS